MKGATAKSLLLLYIITIYHVAKNYLFHRVLIPFLQKVPPFHNHTMNPLLNRNSSKVMNKNSPAKIEISILLRFAFFLFFVSCFEYSIVSFTTSSISFLSTLEISSSPVINSVIEISNISDKGSNNARSGAHSPRSHLETARSVMRP